MCLMLKLLFFGLFLINLSVCNKEKEWWEKTVFYQIYPRSFMDSDGDGIGDIKGITSKLEHLKDAGIGATWLSPIFKSPMVDFGYDISDFKEIHEEYGTMADFEEMVLKAKKLGIKIILDFVPNHSSDQAEWFKKSVNREPGYENYYIWADGIRDVDDETNRFPPNNWISVFRKSAWTWNDVRKQFYLHQFTKEQPDLNFRNSKVVEEMNEVLLFWLDKGVDGFRVDAIIHLFEDESLPNEPVSGLTDDRDSYNYLSHHYTKDLPETYEMVYSWRKLLDEYKNQYGGDTRIIMTEAYANITFTMKYYGDEFIKSKKGAHMPFNFLMITDLNIDSDARDILFLINKWMNYMPAGETPNWVLGNHDQSRVGTRFGPERIDSLNMLLMTLPGVAVSYNGEEIGMLDHTDIEWEDTKDPAALITNETVYKGFSRDPERTPFQWNSTANAGFSIAAKTWLPVNPNYPILNLKLQKQAEKSHFKLYQRLTSLRKTETLINGDFKAIALTPGVLAYERSLEGHDTYVVLINFCKKAVEADLTLFKDLPEKLIVDTVSLGSKLKEGSEVPTDRIELTKYDSVILKHSSSRSSNSPYNFQYSIVGVILSFFYYIHYSISFIF